ncbi:MAG: CHAT domain-containing protein [Planctomycetota bacterium]
MLLGSNNPQVLSKRALATKAWDSCAKIPKEVLASEIDLRGIRAIRMNRSQANANEIRALLPLPETAYEICRVARTLDSGSDSVHLGPQMTENRIRAMSESGKLASFRIVHFATHAAVAGELTSTNEPGLILTPPDQPTLNQDGYLSRTEILSLKLNADWIVLSACNTSAPNTASAEGLSGLAQAFFHAGARSLLVSHWAVNSATTVALITAAFKSLKEVGIQNQSTAVRHAILQFLDKAGADRSHPHYWAPFFVVGS